MSKRRCHMLDRNGTEALVEDNGIPDSAPDNYCHENVRMESGDIAFVQVDAGAGAWETWSVRCVFGGFAYAARKTTEKAARRFLRIAGRAT